MSDESADLAIKNTAMTKVIQDLERKIKELETAKNTLADRHKELLRDLEEVEDELEKERNASKKVKKGPSVITSIDASDINFLDDYWLIPCAHLSVGNKNRLPDDSAARYRHCKKFGKERNYDTKVHFREFVTEDEVRAYAQRILIVVHRKGTQQKQKTKF